MPKYADVADVLVGCLVKSDLLEATIPAKVMSYIAMGKPIVLAMDSEVQNLINTTIGCGFAGSTNDDYTLANNIEKVYHLPINQRAEMGDRAKRYHLEHFGRKILLGKLYNFIFASSEV